MDRIEFYPHPTDDAWCRDHGPIFVRNDRTGEVALTAWNFNAWGGKYPFRKDKRIPARIGRALGARRFANPMVLEGGSIDVNGRGLLLTTEACLLNPNRNPGLTRREIELNLRRFLGLDTILWLGAGIAGDDTDGHVDDLSRFFREDGVITSTEADTRDPEPPPAQGEFGAPALVFALRRAKKFRIVEIALPRPCFRADRRMPASYANFLVINGAVLMPTFRQPRRDAAAAEALGDCCPGREIVAIDCLDLVWGLGAIHCVTQQQPA